MRFIGPRPEVPEYVKRGSFKFLKIIKPGISDYASIILRDENKILQKIGGENPYLKLLPLKIELAEFYPINKSFLLDLKLVLITLTSLFFPNLSVKIFILPTIRKELPSVNHFLEEEFLY